MIQLKNVSKQYLGVRGSEGKTALKDVSLSIPLGQISFVIGPPGSGKSSLLHLIAALDCLTSGEIWFGEECLSKMSATELCLFRKQKIGVLFQSLSLTEGLSALENVLVPIIPDGITPIDVENARILLEQVDLGSHLLFLPSELSIGEQQRVALARAMVGSPQVIIADEPAGELTPKETAELYEYIRQLSQDFGTTFIIATQDSQYIKPTDCLFKLAEGMLVSSEIPPTTVIQTLSEEEYEDEDEYEDEKEILAPQEFDGDATEAEMPAMTEELLKEQEEPDTTKETEDQLKES